MAKTKKVATKSKKVADKSAVKKTGKAAVKPKAAKTGTPTRTSDEVKASLRLLERRRHPRFILSREQFRETKTGRTFPVYDLSASGLSIKIDQQYWRAGAIIQGILNLHPDSIEISVRVLGFYGDRAALRLEQVSTYARSILLRALSPKRLGASLCLVREKLPLADYWFHGVCNTDLLLKLNGMGDVSKVEVFFSNFYWSWTEHSNRFSTGVCQSGGREQREDLLISEEPVKLESIDLAIDLHVDDEKTRWAKGILESAPLEPRLKELLLKKFENPA